MHVPKPTSLEELRFLSVAMQLLRRHPAGAANLLELRYGYMAPNYRPGWNLIRPMTPEGTSAWIFMGADDARTSYSVPNVPASEIHDATPNYLPLTKTSVWALQEQCALQHSEPAWANIVLSTIKKENSAVSDPPTQDQISKARKAAAQAYVDAFSRGKFAASSVAGLLIKNYLELKTAGEIVSIIACEWLLRSATKGGGNMEAILRRRDRLVDLVEQLIEDREGRPPRSTALMTHLASLYGFMAMKIAAELRGNNWVPERTANLLLRSDAHIDELLVHEVQDPTMDAGSPQLSLDMMSNLDAPDIDLLSAVDEKYNILEVP